MSSSKPSPGARQQTTAPPGLNLVVLRGVASSAAEVRTLPSGRRLATLSIRVPGADSRATSVPVAAWDPPTWLADVHADEALVVVGMLRRRFFRDGRGATASRVEVQATTVGRGGQRRRRQAAAQRATRALIDLE
jgi:single-strand DNA-binding protein